MTNKEKKPERRFFEYAFPAVKFCRMTHAGEKVSSSEILRLENLLILGDSPDRKELEKFFPYATSLMKKRIGSENDYWTSDNVEDYWLRVHNTKVEPICRVYFGIVEDILNYDNSQLKNILVKSVNGSQIKLRSYSDVNSGDIVSIHSGFVIEALTPEMIDKYLPGFSKCKSYSSATL